MQTQKQLFHIASWAFEVKKENTSHGKKADWWHTYITMPLKWCFRKDQHENYFLNAERVEILFLINSKYLLRLKNFAIFSWRASLQDILEKSCNSLSKYYKVVSSNTSCLDRSKFCGCTHCTRSNTFPACDYAVIEN